MRQLIILCALFVSATTANAQASSHGKWEENNNDNKRVAVMQDNEFANTEISQNNRLVTFSELPQLSKPIWAIVTDPNGEQLTQKRVTPENNTLDIHRLSRGEMYFVTLVYKNKSQKGFVLHL